MLQQALQGFFTLTAEVVYCCVNRGMEVLYSTMLPGAYTHLHSLHVQRFASAVAQDPVQSHQAILVVHIKLLQVLTCSQSPAKCHTAQ